MIGGMSYYVCLLINLLSAVIAINYMEKGFPRKYKGWLGNLYMVFGCVFYFAAVTFLNIFTQFEGILGLSYVLILIIYSYFVLEGNIEEKIIMGVLWVILSFFCAYFMFALLRIITGLHIEYLLEINGEIRIYSAVAATIIKYVLGCLAISLKKKVKEVNENSDKWAVNGTLLIIFVLMLGMFALDSRILNQSAGYYLTLILLTGFIGLILCLGYFYHKLNKRCREKFLKECENMKLKQQIDHFRQMERSCEEIHVIRHDIKGTMNLLHHLINDGNVMEALKYIEDTFDKIGNMPECPLDTGNKGVDISFMEAIRVSREKEIQFRYVVLAKVACFDDMDMSLLFYNLFKNAVEACDKLDQNKWINVQITRKEEELVCHLYNSIKNSILVKNQKLITSKADKRKHGYGMKSILNIIEKYNGKYMYFEEDEIFIQEIHMKYPK